MNKAKAAVSDFLQRDGKHSTTVHESINPAVQSEHVTPTRHENVTTAVDREVHQDHHHTSVQPIQHKEVLPEQHSHNLAGVENREIHHGNSDHVNESLAAERAQFKNTREVGETQHTQAAAPALAGEHVHHHVHETVQPVIQKETVQPHVVHTTVPVHEVHHQQTKHHAATALPAVSMADFEKSGGALTGREERTDRFHGEPKSLESGLGSGYIGGQGAQGTTHLTERDGGVNNNSRLGNGRAADNGGVVNGQNSGGVVNSQNSDYADGTTRKKGGLIDKINPKVDSNGDGQAGFMK